MFYDLKKAKIYFIVLKWLYRILSGLIGLFVIHGFVFIIASFVASFFIFLNCVVLFVMSCIIDWYYGKYDSKYNAMNIFDRIRVFKFDNSHEMKKSLIKVWSMQRYVEWA